MTIQLSKVQFLENKEISQQFNGDYDLYLNSTFGNGYATNPSDSWFERQNKAFDKKLAEGNEAIAKYTFLGKVLGKVKAFFNKIVGKFTSKYNVEKNGINDAVKGSLCDQVEYTQGITSVRDAEIAYDAALSTARSVTSGPVYA
jgi:hypothetical protein